MLKRLIIIAIISCFSTTICSAENKSRIRGTEFQAPKIVVLPFEIYASENISYLQTKIPEVIGNYMKQEGAVVVEADKVKISRPRSLSKHDIRKIGIRNGADYVIWGSLTRIGQKFSLDSNMMDTLNREPISAFFVEGESIENLPVTVKKLASEFGIKIFKREKVARVLVTGNRRIETDAIKRMIKTKPGNAYLAKSLSEDLKAVYSMGYFDDIRIEARETREGKIITFRVQEKSTLRHIRIKGNKIFEDKEIRDALDIKTGQTLNVFRIQSNIQRIESLYKDKNYHNVSIAYDIRQLDNNQADLEFVIEEGKKIRIKEIAFAGISAYSDKELKKVMKTSEKGFWSWLTSSGEFNSEELEQDVVRLSAFYRNNGYAQARIGEPQVEYREEWIYITIKIDEGPQFKIGKVDIGGDLVLSREELIKPLKITKEPLYNEDVLRNDVLLLADIYADQGYAYANITPRLDKNIAKSTINITYHIEKDKRVYIEKIIISGNTKTRDKIIRRQLKVHEQELYSSRDLKRSVRNLQRLDYFEDVKLNTLKGSSDDRIIIRLDVTEKPTGTFSFGGGYSSVENVFAMASVSQRNLFGRGQILQLKAELGGTTNRYTLSFTEPWLFDIPLSAGFDLYNWERDYDTYDKDSKGGGVRLGYLIYDFTRLYLSYSYDVGDIEIIDRAEAPESIKDMEGENVTSSISTTLRYDSRDKMFNPTEGADHRFTAEYAGLGGDIAFTKYTAELGQYFPLFWGTVGFLHAEGGYVRDDDDGKLPDYERFYLGGMNSLRGFEWRDVSLKEKNEEGETVDVGGYKFVQFNAEFLIPLIKKAGLVGVLFYDTGNVYDKSEDIEFDSLRESAGFGFRWYSPMGPIRIENGYILDPEEGESSSGRWEFTMGGVF
ncbi:outer membrane protein assembly factor BamA [Desulfonema magnum]|uniref:Outer membrane protein assembly factor BamA n=1 Tax=Desulfonema magnum TaxID=45655 RepID=A0A975BUY8_9BACT|nr:outer membrane protein assembly factor BamA [Desulfonema magnum]QTA92236.1 Outer membrane protein assembly complex protein [Desulfonema magnum]